MVTTARAVGIEPSGHDGVVTGYVDWGAIIAGAVIATAISMLFLAFGSALGLSLTSFSDRQSLPGIGVVIAIGLWLMWVQVSASFTGGYVAGRLRRRINDAQNHEVEMRDGLHGLSVWALGLIIGAMIVAATAAVGTIGAATIGAGAAANPGSAEAGSYYVDRLLRPGSAAVPPATDGAAPATQSSAASANGQQISPELRSEVSRLLMTGRISTADSEDRTYLLQRIAAQTGMTEQAVAERLDGTIAAMKSAADQARRMAVLMAFITAVSLLISAVAAWWAATKGGDHRDQALDHSAYIRIR